MKNKNRKHLNYFILILSIVLLLNSCKSKIDLKPIQVTSESVFVTGKVLNPTPENNTVTIYVKDILSGDQITNVSLIDSSGNFQIKFNQYYSQDVLVRYGDNSFPIIVHPKDSIHIVFDSNKISNKDEFAKTIQFSGDASEINSKLIVFHSEISDINIPWEKYCQYEKDCSPTEFTAILDSLKSVRLSVLNDFIKTQNPSTELKNWMMYEIILDYYNWLARYPANNAKFNNLDRHDVVPNAFYDFMNIQFPLESLFNSKSIYFVKEYRLGRITTLMVDNGYLYEQNKSWYYKGNTEDAILETIKQNTNDSLLLEILIARQFFKMLDMLKIKAFEKHYRLFEEIVKLPFLREPIINKYLMTKKHIDNPEQKENTLLMSAKNTPANELIKKIIQEHKGKIIYLDIWATWCSPCRKEMPFSNKLMHELNNENVDLVYLCVDSKENQWKAIISEIGIEGSHYLATPDQSRFLYTLFEMDGVPQYVLIDKEGNIIDKGFQLRPSVGLIKETIENLLKE